MGMNMVTIATEAACAFIEENFKAARCVAISGNMCSDKKESLINNLLGRGKSVIADAIISREGPQGKLQNDRHGRQRC